VLALRGQRSTNCKKSRLVKTTKTRVSLSGHVSRLGRHLPQCGRIATKHTRNPKPARTRLARQSRWARRSTQYYAVFLMESLRRFSSHFSAKRNHTVCDLPLCFSRKAALTLLIEGPKSRDTPCLSSLTIDQSKKFAVCQTAYIKDSPEYRLSVSCDLLVENFDHNSGGLQRPVSGREEMNESRYFSLNSSGSRELAGRPFMSNCRAHLQKAHCLFQ
jgi:hypothetical protein